jgi:hypothetical protein
MRNTSSTTSAGLPRLPGSRRAVPSYFLATSFRYQPSSVRGDERVEQRELFAPELVGGGRQLASLRVRVADAPASKLLAQHGVFGDQVLGDGVLFACHPAGTVSSRNCNGKLDIALPYTARPSAVHAGRARCVAAMILDLLAFSML